MTTMNNSMDTLLFLDQLVSQYCLGLLFILGVIGLTLSTIVFTKRTFRTTSCILYFLASTLANYPVIYLVIPYRFVADGFNLDPAKTNLDVCKSREYILTVSRALSAWFIALASFDRLMSSSRNIRYRQFCHIRTARWMILFATIFALLLYVHIPILFTNDLPNEQCDAPTRSYRIFNDCLYSISYIIIPALLMLIFGFLVIKNQSRSRVAPASQSLRRLKRDRNLFAMFIFQFILFILTTSPQAVQKLYTTVTMNSTNNNDLRNIFFIHTVRMISFINHSCQFYIYTLSSKLFRQELKKSFRQLKGLANQPTEQPTATAVTMNNNQIQFQVKRKVNE